LVTTFNNGEDILDNQTAIRRKRRIAKEFRQQLTFGSPTNEDESALRQLATQIRTRKLIVKVYLRHPLHAKLYLLYRQDINNPITGFLGSSNLTLAGLAKQGELNVDVLEHDACNKLADWFEDRWRDRWCLDISKELADIIDESWAGDRLVSPYHVYLKMAYHLAQEARAGLSEFRIPSVFGDSLFDFQVAAVKTAARHLKKRGSVLIGDVMGLGKSMMATALAKVFEDKHNTETLIICPKNLVSMWEEYAYRYKLHAKIVPLSMTMQELPEKTRRYRVVLIAQLGCEHEFIRRHQCPVRSLAAFDKSEDPDDWRDLMRLYMVRRTRGFIMQHYTHEDEGGKYLLFPDGRKSYFPKRVPKNLSFKIDGFDPADHYARFYSDKVVNAINELRLPRYGLGNYIAPTPQAPPTPQQAKIIEGLSRAGTRLMGFCRTNLFKRLESAGPAFLLSIERHILRNFIVLHAIENNLDIPLGTQGAELLDTSYHDEDSEDAMAAEGGNGDNEEIIDDPEVSSSVISSLRTETDFRARAAKVYAAYCGVFKNRFTWLPGNLFIKALGEDLQSDAWALLDVLKPCGEWNPQQDAKLAKLIELVETHHSKDKLLVFTQFADTARYLKSQLLACGIKQVEEATGGSVDPTALAWRFSPESNGKRAKVRAVDELRVLIATDVLSEGQNLQDCAIIVN